MRNKYLTKFAAELLDNSKSMIFGYNNVILEGDALKKVDGALLIPNHIEAGDTVAIGTSLYRETGMPPYFVMKSSLPFLPVLQACGGIPWSRHSELERQINRFPLQSNDILAVYQNQREQTRKMVAGLVNNGELVTLYLQGGRTPEGITRIEGKYYESLEKWLKPINSDIIPVNLYHSFTCSGRGRIGKTVHIKLGDPVHSGEGIEKVVERLTEHIDVFEK